MSELEFLLPDVGEGIDGADLLEWHVREGQEVREDDPLADVQTDKAVVTIPCPTTGTVLRLCARPGDWVAVHAPLAVFAPAGAARAPAPSAAPAQPHGRPLASPAVRQRAWEHGIALQFQPDDDPDEVAEVVRQIQKIPSQFEGYDTKW